MKTVYIEFISETGAIEDGGALHLWFGLRESRHVNTKRFSSLDEDWFQSKKVIEIITIFRKKMIIPNVIY